MEAKVFKKNPTIMSFGVHSQAKINFCTWYTRSFVLLDVFLTSFFTNLSISLTSLSSLLSYRHLFSISIIMCVCVCVCVHLSAISIETSHSLLQYKLKESVYILGKGEAAALLSSRSHIVTKDFEAINNVSCPGFHHNCLPLIGFARALRACVCVHMCK